MPGWLMVEPSLDLPDTLNGRGRSACPGLFRIVPARDGGICRVKLPLGELSAEQARAVAAAALRFGSGVVEATNRANLQLRGIPPENEAALIAALLAAGLGAAPPGADDIRNVMVSPTAGIDALEEMDVRPLARDLLARLQADETCHALSAKFSFLVDGGEGIAAVDHPHDVWLASMAGGAMMALGFAGCPPLQGEVWGAAAAVRPEHAVTAVLAAVSLFQEEAARDAAITRLRQLPARLPAEAFLDRLAGRLGALLHRDGGFTAWRRRTPLPMGHVGVGMQRQKGLAFVGAQAPLARLTSRMLAGIAALAEALGSGGIRLTPWHGVIVPDVRQERAQRAVEALEALGLVCERCNPLAAIVACAGSAGCAASHSDTKADALDIAHQLAASEAPRHSVHVSGCAKSCASARVADATLVATAAGRYELFLKSNGETAARGKFGVSIAHGLSVSEAGERLLAAFAAPAPEPGRGRA